MPWLLWIALSSSVHAETLHAIALRLPVDEAVIGAKCEVAFQQALKDKEDYENRPEVNLMCALNLNAKQMETLRQGFMHHCVRTFKVRSQGVPAGQTVTLDIRALKINFDGEYAGIFRTICLDRAVSAFHVRQAQQRGQVQAGGAAAAVRSCDGFASCQGEATR